MGEGGGYLGRGSWERRLSQASAGALYLHIPFCARKCAYCDFTSWATHVDDPCLRTYGEALLRLVDQAGEVGLLATIETAYVGGGTPTFMGNALVDLVGDLRVRFPKLEEFSCEANPDSVTRALMSGLAQVGLTRVSMGIQSMHDDELRELGRIHNAEAARVALQMAREAGLSTSCDLMCAIPRQTEASWSDTLAAVVAEGVGHVSVYPLQIEEGTPFDTRYGDAEQPWNDTAVQATRMESAATFLESHGYERYEVASYALAGAQCRHNTAYWTAVPYLGVGSGASTMLTRAGYQLLRGVATQLPQLDSDIARARLTCGSSPAEIVRAKGWRQLSFDLEFLDEAQAAAEDLMLGMRMACGVSEGLLDHAADVLGRQRVDEAIDWCSDRGLIQSEGAAWRPTHEGWLMGNMLYGRLWELAPSEVRGLSV